MSKKKVHASGIGSLALPGALGLILVACGQSPSEANDELGSSDSGQGSHAGGEAESGDGGSAATTGGSEAGHNSGGNDHSSGGDAGEHSGGAQSTGGAGNSSSTCGKAEACGTHKWACWPIAHPPSSDLLPQQSFNDNGDGTVTDNVTCLTWEKINPSTQGTWQDSFDRCQALGTAKFGGFSDWRLPTRIEMASITDVTRGSKGFAEIFEVSSGYYVTGSFWYKTILTDNDTTTNNETNMVWGYGTNGFTSNAIVRTNTNNVARCVSGNGSGEAAGEYAHEPPNHYTIDAEVVTDNYTGLVWQRAKSANLLEWNAAHEYCSGLTLNGEGGFRLPTQSELASSVDEAQVGGAISDEAFPNNPVGCKDPAYWFWAAEKSEVGGTAWGLSYCDGFTGWNVGGVGSWNYFPTANARCVK